jgi:hypothetical protein
VSSNGKNTNTQAAAPSVPARYTGRRPYLSDSAPNSGMSTSWNADPTRIAASPASRGSFTTPVTYVSTYTTKV